MPTKLSSAQAESYARDGFLSPLAALSREQAAYYRGKLEAFPNRSRSRVDEGSRPGSPEWKMTGDVVAAAEVAQFWLGRRVGAHGGPAVRLVHRAARSEPAAADGPLEIEHPPGAPPNGRQRARGLRALLVHQRRPQDLGVGMARRAGDAVREPHLHDLTQVHHRHLVADELHDLQIVRDEQIGKAELPLEIAKQVHHLSLDRDIQRARRLVGHDEMRPDRQGARDAHAALFPTGELPGEARELTLLQVDLLEQLAGLSPHLVIAQPMMHRDRLPEEVPDAHPGVERRVQVLKDHLHLAAQRP